MIHGNDGCAVCLFRRMTEGRPREWSLRKDQPDGDTITGVVYRMGETPEPYSTGTIPFLDLLIEGNATVRVTAYGGSLRAGIQNTAPAPGDTVTVTFLGMRQVERGKYRGQKFRAHSVQVERGHH